jgi:hypothetical protein
MEFNINWTKKDNDKLREFIKQKKDVYFIREYFGNDKLFYHPSKKYYDGKSKITGLKNNKIEDFSGFLNEIKYNSLKTDFVFDFEKSEIFNNKFNYIYKFQTNSGNRYIVDFIYLIDNVGIHKNKDIYNISFTLENNRKYNDYEKQTFLNENNEIIKRLIFIFRDFNERFGNGCIYLIGETEDKRKINWYSNLIKDSFDDFIETVDVSSFTNGLDAYYYEIKNL